MTVSLSAPFNSSSNAACDAALGADLVDEYHADRSTLELLGASRA